MSIGGLGPSSSMNAEVLSVLRRGQPVESGEEKNQKVESNKIDQHQQQSTINQAQGAQQINEGQKNQSPERLPEQTGQVLNTEA